ncbi:DUF1127 domain-containing protein [Mesorhizobium sp. WSM3862]|uniref:DUF1127 domain-containing protein n=1 Tax=Mesorhizobium sp. WSM3862 TaxID=632858 RepID=UPI000BAE93B1|nr:DUF1127 domain-containing protein [Mesorhizobium sp. WSM3862]PBB96775.1 hypothetical protein CK224_21090 [Mesorhizobium sp. WSM3862]
MSTIDTKSGASRFPVNSMLARLEWQFGRRRSRSALLDLSDDLLKDIGVSRLDANREARQPFWR